MRQSRVLFVVLLFLLFCTALLLPGCGSGNLKVASITVTPSPGSVAYGQTVQLNASATTDKGEAVPTTFTFTSDQQNAANPIQVSPTGGNVCGGTWDSNFVNCCPGTWNSTFTVCTPFAAQSPTIANITVTAQNVTQPVQVYMHQAVVAVQVAGGPSGCVSTGNTSSPAFTATAKYHCSTDPSGLCTASDVDPASYQWTSNDTTITTPAVNTTTHATTGTMTAVAPGLTSIFASNANVNSASMPFTTCPITSISLPSLGSGTTQTLAATVTDSNGFKLANNGVVPTGITLPNLSWLSTNQYAAKIAAQTASQSTTTGGVTTTATVQTGSGTVTSGTAGVATLAVSCTPPNCNKNLFPVYSNPVVATASGTPKTALLITSTQGQNLVGFNVATGAFAGIAIGKPPDSFLMNRQGTLGMLGADNSAALIFNPVPATTTTLSVTPVQFNGKVLNISPDGTLAALAGNVPGELQGSIGVVTFATSTLDTFPIAGTATAADFTPDSQYLFVTTQQTTGGVTTNRLYTYQVTGTAKGATVMTLPNATASALDVAVLANGPVGYVAGAGAAGNTNVTAYATCSATPPTHLAADTQSTAPNVETNVRALADGSGAVVLDLPNVELLKPDVPTTKGTLSGCPTTPNTFTEGVTPLTLTTPPAASDVNQFLITPDGTKAVITSKSSGKIYVVQLSSGALTVMSLANNATLQNPSDATKSFKGDIAADSSTFYVGAAETAVSATCPVSATAPVTPPCYTVQAVDLTGASAPSVLITSSTLNAQGLLQPDGVTTATPDFVVIRNQ